MAGSVRTAADAAALTLFASSAPPGPSAETCTVIMVASGHSAKHYALPN